MNNYLIAVIICLTLVILITELFRTQGYEIKKEKIIIKRRIKNIMISKEQIKNIKEVDHLGILLKLFGTSFKWIGSIGIYWSYKIGLFHLCITNKKNLYLITLNNNKKIIISPSDDEKILIKIFFMQFKV